MAAYLNSDIPSCYVICKAKQKHFLKHLGTSFLNSYFDISVNYMFEKLKDDCTIDKQQGKLPKTWKVCEIYKRSVTHITNTLVYFTNFLYSNEKTITLYLDIPASTVLWALYDNTWYQYPSQGLEVLQPSDFYSHLDFCNLLLIQVNSNPCFLRNNLWTDMFLRQKLEGSVPRATVIKVTLTNSCSTISTSAAVLHMSFWCGIWGKKLTGALLRHCYLRSIRYLEYIFNITVNDFMD